jgi:hypothetical protein
MRRRDLLARIPYVIVAIPIAACIGNSNDRPQRGAGGPTEGGGGGPSSGGATDFRVENHDDSGHLHWFHVTCDDVDAHRTSYTAEGPHMHTVSLTEDDFDQLLEGNTVTVHTTNPHPHTWLLQMPDRMCT